MGAVRTSANASFRDYATDGVPASGAHEPVKSEARATFGVVEDAVDAAVALANAAAAGRRALAAVRVRSTANVVIATALENGDTLNGLSLVTGDRVFLGSQTAPAENGIYVVPASGAASRATDADTAAKLARCEFLVLAGTVGAGDTWHLPLESSAITVGTTALNFVQTLDSAALIAVTYTKGIPAYSTYFFGAAGNTTATGVENVGGGAEALLSVAAGVRNTALGYRAGYSITSGGNNVGIGNYALFSAASAGNNVAVGSNSLFNATGANNTAIGFQSGYTLTTGAANVIIGRGAFYNNETGSNNVAIGNQALYSSTVGGNTAIGDEALYSTTTAAFLTAVGRRAAYGKTTGNDCSFFGVSAGFSGLAGEVNTGGGNTAIGAYSFGHTTTGSYNTGCGRASGWYVSTGSNNTALGYRCGYGNVTGDDNVAIGFYAGHNTPSGSDNVMIGSYADYYIPATGSLALAANTSGSMALGAYNYRVTFVLDGVESALSTDTTGGITLTGVQDQVDLSGIPTYTGPKTCSARKIYRTKVGGENEHFLVTTIADNTTTTFSDTLADGSLGAAPTSPSGSIMLGYGATAYKAGQMVVGSSDAPISEVYIGGGVDATSPAAVTHLASNASGTNVAGGSHRIAGGRGTGTAKGGSVILAASPTGSSGTAPNALTDWVELDGAGFLNIKETTSAAVSTPAAGSLNLFAEGGVLKIKNSSGSVSTL